MPGVESLHEQAVEALEKLLRKNLGASVEVSLHCNQCRDELQVNLLDGVAEIRRNVNVGSVRPDLSMFDADGKPRRFVEVVDSHAPEKNVHLFAAENDVEVFEVHLATEFEFLGRRRNKALDEVLTKRTRIKQLAEGTVVIDAHNLLCNKPKCADCGRPLPLREISIREKDCWKCGRSVIVAVGHIDGGSLEQDEFTDDEIEFARENGVTLERRFSATAGGRYLANVCTGCDQIQGNWFLYMDPFHDRFNLPVKERQEFGPCNECAERYCYSHGEYVNHREPDKCPACLIEAEKVMCPNVAERECFYPDRCEQDECYFVKRERERREAQEQWERENERRQQEFKGRQEDEKAERQRQYEDDNEKWRELQRRFDESRRQSGGSDAD